MVAHRPPHVAAPDKRHEYVSVIVSANGEEIVCIETNCLSGREISSADELAIEWAANTLLGFIGKSAA